MLAFLGTTGLVAALIGSALLVWRGSVGARSGNPVDLRNPALLLLSGSVVAMAAMVCAVFLMGQAWEPRMYVELVALGAGAIARGYNETGRTTAYNGPAGRMWSERGTRAGVH